MRSCHCLPLPRTIKPNSKLRQEMRVLPTELALRSIHVLSRKAVMPRHDRFRVLARSFTCFPGFTAKLHTSSLLSRASERSYIPQNPRHPRSKFQTSFIEVLSPSVLTFVDEHLQPHYRLSNIQPRCLSRTVRAFLALEATEHFS